MPKSSQIWFFVKVFGYISLSKQAHITIVAQCRLLSFSFWYIFWCLGNCWLRSLSKFGSWVWIMNSWSVSYVRISWVVLFDSVQVNCLTYSLSLLYLVLINSFFQVGNGLPLLIHGALHSCHHGLFLTGGLLKPIIMTHFLLCIHKHLFIIPALIFIHSFSLLWFVHIL